MCLSLITNIKRESEIVIETDRLTKRGLFIQTMFLYFVLSTHSYTYASEDTKFGRLGAFASQENLNDFTSEMYIYICLK